MALAPLAVIALLLLLATVQDGAFDLRYWAPLTLLVLVVLAAMVFGDGLRLPRSRAVIVVLAAIWGFAAWDLLSAAWADSAARAWEGGARTLLYAALVTVGLTALPDRRQRSWLGLGLVLGVTAIGVVTLVVLLGEGTGPFLAGRLNDPVGYRNGTAALFAFAVWPLIGAAAPRGGAPSLRAAALAAAVLLLGLAFLTQSRGVLIGVVAGGIVSLAIGPDRLRRAWLALGAAGLVAIASPKLLDPYDAFKAGDGTITGGEVGSAAQALLIIVLVAFVAGLALAVLDNGLRTATRAADRVRQAAAAALALVVAVGAIGALVAIGNPVNYADQKLDEFTDLEGTTSDSATRLGSVGGQRYDLWRVAWDEFSAKPLVGVGEGNYEFGYFEKRRTDRNLNDTHSLPLRLLAETGLVGAGLFTVFLIALGVAITARARSSEDRDRRWIAGLAAAGTAMLAQTLTDWLWLIPGLLGLAFLALALAAAEDDDDDQQRGEGVALPFRLLGGAVLIGAIVSVSLLYLSDLYVRKAREAGTDPQERLDAARTAADLNPVSVIPLYLEASALETDGDRNGARDALNEALDQEPENFVTLGLLGDLEFRAGNQAAARAYYSRALALNPRDVGIQELSGRPVSDEDQ
jgi:tetratricopeptide (TPR) repeat protein/uncharacterized membrane protein YgdD (TMEM256/DUF423 family)